MDTLLVAPLNARRDGNHRPRRRRKQIIAVLRLPGAARAQHAGLPQKAAPRPLGVEPRAAAARAAAGSRCRALPEREASQAGCALRRAPGRGGRALRGLATTRSAPVPEVSTRGADDRTEPSPYC